MGPSSCCFTRNRRGQTGGELEGGQGDGVHLDQLTVNILVDMEIFSFESGKRKIQYLHSTYQIPETNSSFATSSLNELDKQILHSNHDDNNDNNNDNGNNNGNIELRRCEES